MKVSACIITKNEEAVIKRCIDSFKDVVSEIIVVDSGSTDATCQIAQSLGAKVYFREWDDDFSAARNYCLSKASYPYIIFLDADEYFDKSSKLDDILAYLELHPEIDGFFMQMRHINDGALVATAPAVRIFKYSPDMVYKYKIHESITASNRKLLLEAVSESIAFINHTGYQINKFYWKCKRNLQPLLDELHSDDPRPNIHFFLADCYRGINQPREAAEHSRKFIDSGSGMDVYKPVAYLALVSSTEKLGDPSLYLRTLREAAEACPEQALFPYLQGTCYFRQRELRQAQEYFLQSYDKFLEFQKNENLANKSNLRPDLLPSILYLTARTYFALGDKQKALEYALKTSPHGRKNHHFLTLLLHLSDNPEHARQLIDKMYDTSSLEDLLFIVTNLLDIRFSELNRHYFKLYDQLLSRNNISRDTPVNLTVRAFSFATAGDYRSTANIFSGVYAIDFNTASAYSMVTSYILSDRPPLPSLKLLHPSLKRIVQIYDQKATGSPITVKLLSEDYSALLVILIYLLDFGAYDKLCFASDYLENDGNNIHADLFEKHCGYKHFSTEHTM